MRTEGDVTIFFTCNSPLSNHYPIKMTVDNKCFTSNEQFYFYKRAEVMGDETIQDRVMKTHDPREVLRHGRKARNYNAINEEEEEIKIMKRGVKEKFSQNQALKDFLMATAQNYIGEASKSNTRWGTGLHLHHRNAFKRDHWAPRGNQLGEILMAQRELFNS